MNKRELAERFAWIHSSAREQAKVSQETMAAEIGVSRKTIAKWESGESCPTFVQSLDWFRVLQINPMPRYSWVTSKHKADFTTDDNLDERLHMLIDMLDIDEKRKLAYILSGNHGSSPAPLLDLIVSYCHLPLMDRLVKATVVHQSYKLTKEMGMLWQEEETLPDLEALEVALDQAQKAVMKHMNSYGLNVKDED